MAGRLNTLPFVLLVSYFLALRIAAPSLQNGGELIAFSGKVLLGFETEDRMLKDIREDLETLMDLLYAFTLWLFRMSIPVMCCFEQYVTDYSARLAFKWEELVSTILDLCLTGSRMKVSR